MLFFYFKGQIIDAQNNKIVKHSSMASWKEIKVRQ